MTGYKVESPLFIGYWDTYESVPEATSPSGFLVKVDSFWINDKWDMGGWSQISHCSQIVRDIKCIPTGIGQKRYLVSFYPVSHSMCAPFEYYGLEYFDGIHFLPYSRKDKCGWCDSQNVSVKSNNEYDTFYHCADCGHDTSTEECSVINAKKYQMEYVKPIAPLKQPVNELKELVSYLFYASFKRYYVTKDIMGGKNWVKKTEYFNWKTKTFQKFDSSIKPKNFYSSLILLNSLQKNNKDNMVKYVLMERSQADFIHYMTQE